MAKTPPTDAFFLAEYVFGQSSGIVQANEMLALLQTLWPVYDKQPPNVQGAKRWQQHHVSFVSQAGRTDEAVRLWKQLATDYPRDYQQQTQYANALANSGDYPAAYAWLTRVLVKDAKWLDHEEASLRNTYINLMRQEGRYAELVKYIAAWIDENPNARSAYEYYLGVLIKADRIADADKLALGWLKDAQVPGELRRKSNRDCMRPCNSCSAMPTMCTRIASRNAG